MINRKYNKKTSTKMKIKIKGIIKFIIILIIAFNLVLLLFRNSIKEAVSYQCKAIATKTIAEKAESTLEELGVKYEDIITTKLDENGNITSVSVNTIETNKIKNKIETRISNELIEFKRHTYKIPLGTMLGSSVFSGRGPLIPLKISPVGYVKTELVSDFQTAGINQTAHNINLQITVDMSAVVPMYKAETKTTTNLLIAQTIIVGEVPKYYSNIKTNDSELKSDIKDDEILKQNLN